MRVPIDKADHRSLLQIEHHYKVEKQLADRLRSASAEERRILYSTLYDELFRQVPDHPNLMRKTSEQDSASVVEYQMRFLRQFLHPNAVFLEVGAGDCSLSLEVAKTVSRVYAIDVSQELAKGHLNPKNMQLIITDGCNIPLPCESVDIAYSNQLMEHLHPEDAWVQLQNVYTCLKPGGTYFCITPNRLNGPHDVSKYFDDVATGFHLKEYTVSDLDDILRCVGFKRVTTYVGVKVTYIGLPACVTRGYEGIISLLPGRFRHPFTHYHPFDMLLGIRIGAVK